jgi:hypothetical protein
MPKRLGAIVLIYCCAAIAWTVLGATLTTRTEASDVTQSNKLSAQWGSAQAQIAPAVSGALKHGTLTVPLIASRIDLNLNLERRRKGLLWYNLYDVRFFGRYRMYNDSSLDHLTFRFALPSDVGTYSDIICRVGGRDCERPLSDTGMVPFDLRPGGSQDIEIGYSSRGRDSWLYRFGDGVTAVNDLAVTMTTNFDAIDYPWQTLLPTDETRTGAGWKLDWRYSRLMTANGIGLTIPSPMQPGPLASRITFWAPVALLFYFFVLLIITKLRGVDLHPVNYFFLACAFFAFHLLLAYLVDRISIAAAFTICSLTSMFLTITYLRLVVGWRFAAVESGLAQVVYLILFSYALFNEGWSGLTITLGAITTLFVAMQVTARMGWEGPTASRPSSYLTS